ncbi:hypothetical protein [Variovorax sp. KBW07]|uniref:hypothetical protein n=1 Tax=Variovorax sp. KBW07 TaxID=2153358 RepID=UPI000F5754F7|nr:hypothetical protein [Variovorax sp. KBW07]
MSSSSSSSVSVPHQWHEFLAAHNALKARRAAFDGWIESVVMGEPFDCEVFRNAMAQLDASHRLAQEKSELLVHQISAHSAPQKAGTGTARKNA